MVKPPTARSVVPSPARLGLISPSASADLAQLGWGGEDSIPVLWSLSRAPDADLALRTLVRLAEALGAQWPILDAAIRSETPLRGRLFALVGGSSAFGDHLVAHPQAWRLLQGEQLVLPPVEQLKALFLSVVAAQQESRYVWRAGLTGPDAVAALRTAYRDRLMVLAAVDLAATVENEPVVPFHAVGEHLADLADAALTGALAVAVATACKNKPWEGRLAVVAMGKCGARELNYISDVDVVFAAEPADSAAARIAGEMMRIGSSAFFEVDAALRPEGKAGALVRTLDSHVAYYKRWAKTWEFQALLKARPMTGDMELGQAYFDALNPMVWTASERPDFVQDVQAMRRRVEDNVPAELRSRELKLGRGGLRDVEFAVQLLQMVHGRFDESLRVRSTLDALAALSAGGYVGRDDAGNLAASYEFLRLLEHRLQIQKLRRTHTLPPDSDEEAMRWLARCAHMRPDGMNDATGVLRAEIKHVATRVRALHTKLFYRPLLGSVAALDGQAMLSQDAAVRQLAALGYLAPQAALGHLAALTGQSRRGRIQALLLPTLLETLADTPDPDAGLLAYRRLSEGLTTQTWFPRILRDEASVAERLMRILGSSAYVAELLIRAPEVIRDFADGPSGPKLLDPTPAEVGKRIRAAVARGSDPQRAVATARSLRRYELARIASADVLGLLSVPQVCEALSSVWTAVLDASLAAVIGGNQPAQARLSVIGMGRLGGAELGYGSDADVLFVCEPAGDVSQLGPDELAAAETAAVRWSDGVVNQLRTMLGTPSVDPPLEIDTGLRPEGRNGPVVRTLASYRAYYEQWSAPWEMQALLRATWSAGDAELGLDFLHMIDAVRYPEGGVSADAVREIRRIKARVDSERLPRGADPATHTKLGRGGLADIEWTVQLLALKHAHEVPGLHNTSTLQSLVAAAEAGIISQEDADLLRDGWINATKTRDNLVLVRGKAVDQLPRSGKVLAGVAQLSGYNASESGEFLDHYLRVARRSRAVVERVFGA
jgi:glutamate-ammonia-ligase adenylyltransferase